MAFKVVDGKVVRVEEVTNAEIIQKVNELEKKINPYKLSLEKRKQEVASLDKQIEALTNERVTKATQITSYEKFIAEENIEMCREYGIKGAPTLIITDGDNYETYYGVPEIKKYLASL